MTTQCIRLLSLSVILCLSPLITACPLNEDETTEGIVAPVSAASPLGLLQFNAEVDNSLTSSCGSASADTGSTSTTSTSTSTSSSSTSSSSSSATEYKITSFYTFSHKLGGLTYTSAATMLLKYSYFTTREKFSLAPTSSAVSTCLTADYISCSTTGSFTCETIDNISCGGTNSFIFTYKIQPTVQFEGSVGTIDWSEGYTLSSSKTAVAYAKLKIDMVASDGTVFVGQVLCRSDDN